MNLLQRLLGTIFPPYKFATLRKEQSKFFKAIIQSLPDNMAPFKAHTIDAGLFNLNDWALFPGFKFVPMSYGVNMSKAFKRGENALYTGIQIYSVMNKKWEEVEIIVKDNIVCGLKITNSGYKLQEFDITRVNGQHAVKHPVHFEPSEAELLYQSLDADLQAKIDPLLFGEVEFNNKTFFPFYDLENGNYFAIDKREKVYSLIHDAHPVAALMKISLREMLEQLENQTFDVAEHMNERYS